MIGMIREREIRKETEKGARPGEGMCTGAPAFFGWGLRELSEYIKRMAGNAKEIRPFTDGKMVL